MHEALRLFAALEPATTDWILSVGLERTIVRNDAIRKFCELSDGLTQLAREVTNAAVLIEIERALHREFVPYLHLTETVDCNN